MANKLTSVNDLLIAIQKTRNPFQPKGTIDFGTVKIIWNRKRRNNQWNYRTRIYRSWEKTFDIEDIDLFAEEIDENTCHDVHKVSIMNAKIENVIYDYKKSSPNSKYKMLQDEVRSSINVMMIKNWLLCNNTIVLYYGPIPRFRIDMYKIVKSGNRGASGDTEAPRTSFTGKVPRLHSAKASFMIPCTPLAVSDVIKSGHLVRAGCYTKTITQSVTLPSHIPICELLDIMIIPDMSRLICNSKKKLKEVLHSANINIPNGICMIILNYIF